MRPLPVRYVLHPGKVKSRNDGQIHFVSARPLAACYGVPFRECVVYPAGKDDWSVLIRREWRDPPGAIHLYPRYDGCYELPTPA